jgi:hypothetical protein
MPDETNIVPLSPEAIRANGAQRRAQRLTDWVGHTLAEAERHPTSLTAAELKAARDLIRGDEAE